MSKKTQFMADLTGMIDEAKGNAEDVVKLASLNLFTKIVKKTPVDTGHLAYNWNLTLNSPERSERDGVDPSKSKTLDIGSKNIANFKLGVQQVWMTNNVEYAYDIEYGKSKIKAPQGMVRVSLREWDSVYKGAAMTVNKGTGSKQNRYK
jgi:nucleoid DNA-binding protein